ncbi:MAG: sensor histidine kinase [Bryobacteraceae bacterium]
MAQESQWSTSDLLELLVSELNEFVIVLVGVDGLFASWHPGVRSCFGYDPDEFVGKEFDILLPPADRAKGVGGRELKEAANSGRASDTRWLVDKSGNRILVEGVTVALRRAGELVGFGKVLRDIAKRHYAESSLRGANERLEAMAHELERSNEELEEFARIASHDLSAPITSTRWLVDSLRMRHSTQLDAAGKDLVQQISQSLERMGDLVEAVLAHARVGTSAIASAEFTDAEEALAYAMDDLRKDIELSGSAISHDPLPRLYIDPQALAQLFQNLLSNSLKYRRLDVPPEIHIGAVHEDSMWRIAVRDNGMGIEKDWFERIFQPFQRCHGADIAGSGIGLATCRKIVSRAGGRIWVESQPGAGSSFFFTLPGE